MFLQKDSETLRQLIDLAPDAVFIANLDARYVYVNESALKMLGYSRAEMLQKSIWDLIPPEDQDRLRGDRDELLHLKNTNLGEWKLKKKDETYLEVEVHAAILSEETWVAFVRDISERNKIQRVLEKSERSFRLLTESLPVGVWQMDENGKVVYGNPTALKIWGGSRSANPEEFQKYKAGWSHSGKAIAPEEWAGVRAIRNGESSVNEEIVIERFDGTTGVILNSASPIRDENGKIIGALILNEDITEKKEIEKERQELNQRIEKERAWLEAVFQNSPLGIVTLQTEDMEHPNPNRVAETAFGPIDWKKGRSAYIGVACNAMGKPLSKDELTSTRLMRGEVINSEEQVLHFPDGSEVPILVSGGPIKDKVGQILGAVAFFQDLTRQKKLEQALRESESKAKEEARIRQELVAIVSHDLRNPLSTVLMALDVLEEKIHNLIPNSEESISELFRMIGHSARNALNLVKNVLDMAKVDSGTFEVHRIEIPIEKLDNSIQQVLAPLARKKEINFQAQFDKGLQISCDPERLFQVFSNLVGNALKFTSKGGQITVGSRQVPDGLLFFVSDTGSGISKEDISNVFDRYWQAKASGHLGAGLGLYVVKGVVEAHGGRIWVESEVGRGTTFFFTLPTAIREHPRPHFENLKSIPQAHP